MDGTSLNHKPNTDRWAFDEKVAACFDDMLARSIPQYETMRKAVFEIACRYVRENTAVVDLGCSRGEAMAPLVERFGSQNFFVGVENSEPMYNASRERFAGYIRCGVVDIRRMDLRREYPHVPASVTLAVLTLQFIPLEYRQKVVQQCFDSTVAGGILIVVEKILGETADIDDVLTERYYAMKRENGYPQETIDAKRASLEGVLVPVTAQWNEAMLRNAGFRRVDGFWRWMNFAGWLAVKG